MTGLEQCGMADEGLSRLRLNETNFKDEQPSSAKEQGFQTLIDTLQHESPRRRSQKAYRLQMSSI